MSTRAGEGPAIQAGRALYRGEAMRQNGFFGARAQDFARAAESLARAYLQGAREAVFVQDAASASRADEGDAPVRAHLARFNRILKSRGLAPLRARWARGGEAPEPGRRRLVRTALAAIDEAEEEFDAQTALSRLQGQGESGADRLFAFVPRIDPAACTGCDACLNACPHDCLQLARSGESAAVYALHPQGCDGCDLCASVCAEWAIEVGQMQRSPRDIELRVWRCRACGVEVHEPASRPEPMDGLCTICRQTGHHKKLFQVIE